MRTKTRSPKEQSQTMMMSTQRKRAASRWGAVLAVCALVTTGLSSESQADHNAVFPAIGFSALASAFAPAYNNADNAVESSADALHDSARELSRSWEEEVRYQGNNYNRRETRRMYRLIEDYVESTDKLTRRLRARESDKLINRQMQSVADRGEAINTLTYDLRTSRQFNRALQSTEKEFINARDALDRYPNWRSQDARYSDRRRDDRRDDRRRDRRNRSHDAVQTDGVRVDLADRVEDLSERFKNEFRAHVKRHPELRNKPWRSRFDGMLSQFDQTANLLQKNARKGYGQKPARELQSRARNIDQIVRNKPVGPQTRQLWNSLYRSVEKL